MVMFLFDFIDNLIYHLLLIANVQVDRRVV